MGSYEFIEHTADMKIRAKGKDFVDAMNAAIQSIIDIINKENEEGSEEKIKIKVKEKFIEDIVVNTLEKIVILSEINGIVPTKGEVISFASYKNGYELEAVIFGKKKEEVDTIIKAITYHQLKIEQRDNETIIEFIIDI
jgi:SHS2 domain-containing protein